VYGIGPTKQRATSSDQCHRSAFGYNRILLFLKKLETDIAHVINELYEKSVLKIAVSSLTRTANPASLQP
jgi:hypothetical protein